MKKTLIVLVLLLVIAKICGQSLKEEDVLEHSFSILSVGDKLIYQTLDSVLEKERSQPYYTDSTLSLYMNFFFCTDSSCNPIHDVFLVDIGFSETYLALEQYIARGYFHYHGFNVFVSAYIAPAFVFQNYITINNYSSAVHCDAICPLKEFPQGFTMLREDDSSSTVPPEIWNKVVENNIMEDSRYDFYHSLYLHHHDTLRLIMYSYEE